MKKIHYFLCGGIYLLLQITAVLTVSAPSADENQSYLLALGEVERNLKLIEPLLTQATKASKFPPHLETIVSFEDLYKQLNEEIKDNSNEEDSRGKDIALEEEHQSGSDEIDFDQRAENNTDPDTVIVYKNTHIKDNALSQTAMDIITIVWYIATFLALAAFFLLMACSDRRCSDELQNNNSPNNNNNGMTNNDAQQPPPTPSPSYSQFAPPSYETVMMMQNALKASPGVYVIPIALDDNNKEAADIVDGNTNGNGNGNGNNNNSNNGGRPIFTLYTIDETQQKSAS